MLHKVPNKETIKFRSLNEWCSFVENCDNAFVEDLRERATPEEWLSSDLHRAGFFDGRELTENGVKNLAHALETDDGLTAEINIAFALGDLSTAIEAIGNIAKSRGMSQVSKETGLARESLYRSLHGGGNPEFATVLKVLSSIGLQLTVSKAEAR